MNIYQKDAYDALKKVLWWMEVAKGTLRLPKEFLRFIALWEGFNGLMQLRASRQRRSSDKVLLENTAKDPLMVKSFCSLVSQRCYSKFLNELEALCPVYEVWGGQRQDGFSISEPYQLAAVLNLIYKIRCNLYHGQKGPDERDLQLTQLAYSVLQPLALALVLQANKELGIAPPS